MLVIGGIFVDVKGFAREKYMPEERNVGDVQVVAGGVCRNVAENLTKLGQPVQFVSMVDDNALGRDVRDGLRAVGVDDTHVLSAERGMGMWLAILDEKGDLAGSISRQPDFAPLEAYLAENGGEVIAAMGGSTMLPQTVVLDRTGVVTYNQVGSVTYEALEELVAAAGA